MINHDRNTLVIVGGVASGLALALCPPRWWARVGSVVGGTAAGIARSALAPMLIGAALSQLRRDKPTTGSGVVGNRIRAAKTVTFDAGRSANLRTAP